MVNMADRDLLKEARDSRLLPRLEAGRQASVTRTYPSRESSWRAGTSSPGSSKLETRAGQQVSVRHQVARTEEADYNRIKNETLRTTSK